MLDDLNDHYLHDSWCEELCFFMIADVNNHKFFIIPNVKTMIFYDSWYKYQWLL